MMFRWEGGRWMASVLGIPRFAGGNRVGQSYGN